MVLAFLLSAGLAFTQADARMSYATARRLVEKCTPRDAGTIRGRIAANNILDAASAAGANVRRDAFTAKTPSGDKEFTNLYAEFRAGGDDAKWVVLVSHYDTKPGVNCPGANDGASTSGLLVGIANAVLNWKERRGNLLLVWTDGEECAVSYGPDDGLWGSRRAAEYLSERNRKVQAVVCLDMLGDRDLSISIPSNGSPALTKIAVHAARQAGLPDLVRPIPDVVKDDHVPFMEKGYPAIDLIDFSYGPDNSFWHTENDTVENISEESLLKSGRVVAEMLNILL
ncbi:MAG: Zn-dependent exopeptidase M28 [Kiritimatiellae bacterium]|nr:Zn-dependent exopeptidase M28 [Kiritimatiellia bacterium]